MDVVVKPHRGFLIWSKSGSNPRVFHPTRERAEAEASRLAAKYPGKAFFVVSMDTKHKAEAQAAPEAEAA